MVRGALVLALTLALAACSGGGDSNGSNHDSLRRALEAERQARLAELAKRDELQAEIERLKQQIREADNQRFDIAQARRDAEALKRQIAELERQLALAEFRAEQAESDRRERDEAVAPPKPGTARTFLPWPDHSSPVPTANQGATPYGLGPWNDPEQGLSMLIGHANFGVRKDADGFTPWIHGRVPDGSLYSNDEVRRVYDEYGYYTTEFSKFRWTGALLGYTPDARVVTGKATLGDFDFSGRNYQGGFWDPGKSRLEFTELQYKGGGAWGDGDLLYWVYLGSGPPSKHIHNSSFFYPARLFSCTRHPDGCNANSLRMAPGGDPRHGSDAGVIRGLLLGPKHEAMAGTLQRDDLTAAFGGER